MQGMNQAGVVRQNVRAAMCWQVMQLGSSHPDVATTMANTAGLLKALGKHSEAETVYRTVRSPCRSLQPPRNHANAVCVNASRTWRSVSSKR